MSVWPLFGENKTKWKSSLLHQLAAAHIQFRLNQYRTSGRKQKLTCITHMCGLDSNIKWAQSCVLHESFKIRMECRKWQREGEGRNTSCTRRQTKSVGIVPNQKKKETKTRTHKLIVNDTRIYYNNYNKMNESTNWALELCGCPEQ